MAITRISGEQSFGGRIGSAVGSGISGLLDNLAMQKAKELEQRNNAKGYEQAWNLTPEQSKFIASQSPEFQQDFVKALHAQQQSEAFQRAIGGGEQQPDLAQNMGNMIQPQQPQQSLQDTMGGMGGQQIPQDAILMALQKGLGGQGQGQPTILPQQSAVQSGLPPQQEQPQTPQPQSQGRSIADIVKGQPLNPNLLAKAEELNLKKEGIASRSKEKAYEYNKETISKARESAKRAEQDNKALEQILKANDSGKLLQGPTRKLLEKLGLEEIVTNTPTQFVAKQIERFVTGAPSKFGTSRFTNFLAESYQKGNLRLVNTKEAVDLIGKGIILENKKEEAYYNSMRDIEKEAQKQNKPIPYDLADQALERARPLAEKYDAEAVQNLEKVLAGSGNNKTSFESLPTAKDYTGKTITDTKTGAKYKSNGTKWVKA